MTCLRFLAVFRFCSRFAVDVSGRAYATSEDKQSSLPTLRLCHAALSESPSLSISHSLYLAAKSASVAIAIAKPCGICFDVVRRLLGVNLFAHCGLTITGPNLTPNPLADGRYALCVL